MRTDAYVLITCDACGVSEEVTLDMTTDGGWAPLDIDGAIDIGDDWVAVNDHDFCSGDCAREYHGDLYDLIELATEHHDSI